MPDIVIYTQPWCPYCSRAIALLKQKGVDFKEIDAPQGSKDRAESVARSGGRTSVPQVFVGERHLGGSDDLRALDQQGLLDALLHA